LLLIENEHNLTEYGNKELMSFVKSGGLDFVEVDHCLKVSQFFIKNVDLRLGVIGFLIEKQGHKVLNYCS
jgi:hypothetical protein